VGAVEQEAVLLRPRTVDRNLWRASANDVVARGERGSDARLQQRELLERPAVERQIANLPIVDEPADRRVGEVDARGFRRDADFGLDGAELQRQLEIDRLADGQLDATPG